MFARERQEEIAELTKQNGRVLVNDLAEKYHVTKDLIRKDLNVLENEGVIEKVYGGAIAVKKNPHNYSVRSRRDQHPANREEIAEKCVHLIKDGDTVYLDVSVTSIMIAKKLLAKQIKCKIITGMIDVLNVLAESEMIDIFFLGGSINKERDGFWSGVSLANLCTCHIDKAFLGVVGIDTDKNMITTYYEADGMLKSKAMALSEKSYALADTNKFNETGEYIYAKATAFSGIIVDNDLNKKERDKMISEGVKVI